VALFNTIINSQPPVLSGQSQGFSIGDNAMTPIGTNQINNNTFVLSGSIAITYQVLLSTISSGTIAVQNNYTAFTNNGSSYGFLSPNGSCATGGITVSGNTAMSTGNNFLNSC
jgi:hypothetical protein